MDAELVRFLTAKWPRLAARVLAFRHATADEAQRAAEAQLLTARRDRARAVAEAESRAAIFDAHSEETHGLRIKATQLAAQLEALRRREQDMQEEIR